MSVTFNDKYTRGGSVATTIDSATGGIIHSSGGVVLPGSYLARRGLSSAITDSVGQGIIESTLASITVAANTLGINDGLEIDILWSCTNTAAVKRLRGLFGGTVLWNFDLSTNLGFRQNFILRNRNSQSSQVVQANTSTGFAPIVVGVQTFGINFAVEQTLTFTGQFPVAGTSLNTMAVEEFSVKLI